MIYGRVRGRNLLAPFAAIAGIVSAGVVAALALVQLSGTKTGTALALAAVGGPLAVYAAMIAPLIFPFGVYVFAVPFDGILDFTAFGTLTKLLAILSGAAIVFYLIRTRRTVSPPGALYLWCALFAWAGITTFWAIDQQVVFAQLATSLELLALYAAISFLPVDRPSIRVVSFATIAGGVAAAAYGAYLFHNGLDLYYGGRLRITTDNGAIDPNHFAAALLLPIALCLSATLTSRKPWTIAINLGALAALAIGLALSESRGGFLAIALMVIYMFARMRGSRWRLGALVAIGAVFVLALAQETHLWERLATAISTGGAGRTSIWRVGLVALKSNWVLGAGYANFPFAYDRAFLQTEHQIASLSTWHRAAHDLLLQTGVELGIVGLVLTLGAWIAQFRMLRNIEPADADYPLRVSLEATLIGTFAASLFLDLMIFKHVWLTFMFAALLRNAHIRKKERTPEYARHVPAVLPSLYR